MGEIPLEAELDRLRRRERVLQNDLFHAINEAEALREALSEVLRVIWQDGYEPEEVERAKAKADAALSAPKEEQTPPAAVDPVAQSVQELEPEEG